MTIAKMTKECDSDLLSSSITFSSHSSTTGIMTYSVTNDQWMMCFLSSAITRKQYKQFLKKCYRQPLPDDDKLLTTASKHYIELAVISKKGITRKQADEFTRKSLHGLTEEILHEKAPIALDHILKPREDGRPVRCVLVEGAPGIGKSTLAWEVCHKWEELESVKQYELVVLVCLREKKAQEARCLGDLLPCDGTTNMKELLATIGEGEGMLIVCDGFDELPREQRQEGSVYIDLLKGRLLAEATIIVTSRPSVSAELLSLCQHNIDRHLEVIGFTREDIKHFAESVFSGDILAGFLSYITNNPPIYGMMYIPLNAVFVALIYQDSYDTDTPFPTTMTQLFDALTRGLIRRHLVSTRQVPSEYCMPPSLQRTEDISKLPRLVGQQLLQLAKVAYESLCKKIYVFTDLGEDFEHLGTMKKTTSVNACTGPGCSYSFLHLTLQEYLTALHIAIVNPSGFELVEWFKGDSVVVRFLAGMYRHDDYHSHPVYQELVQLLASNELLVAVKLVHCAYECPSIMDSVKVDYSEKSSLYIETFVKFDWYATGYCISHFDEEWGLFIGDEVENEELDLLVMGLRSSLAAKGKIRSLVLSIESLSLSEVMTLLGEFCDLHDLDLLLCDDVVSHNDEVVLQQLIAPGSGLRSLRYTGRYYVINPTCPKGNSEKFVSLMFHPSSLQVLELIAGDEYTGLPHELLPHENTNLLKLKISSNLLRPHAALIINMTSLVYLEINNVLSEDASIGPLDSDLPVLTNIVQSHHTLEVLRIGVIQSRTTSSTNLLQLIITAGNSGLKKIILDISDYDELPSHILEQYHHLLEQSVFKEPFYLDT